MNTERVGPPALTYGAEEVDARVHGERNVVIVGWFGPFWAGSFPNDSVPVGFGGRASSRVVRPGQRQVRRRYPS